MQRYKFLKDYKYALDAKRVISASKGEVHNVPNSLVPALVEAEVIEKSPVPPAAPDVKAKKAPKTKEADAE